MNTDMNTDMNTNMNRWEPMMNIKIFQYFGYKTHLTCDQIANQMNLFIQGQLSLHNSSYIGHYAKLIVKQGMIKILPHQDPFGDYRFPSHHHLDIIISVVIDQGKKRERLDLAQTWSQYLQEQGFCLLEESQHTSPQ